MLHASISRVTGVDFADQDDSPLGRATRPEEAGTDGSDRVLRAPGSLAITLRVIFGGGEEGLSAPSPEAGPCDRGWSLSEVPERLVSRTLSLGRPIVGIRRPAFRAGPHP